MYNKDKFSDRKARGSKPEGRNDNSGHQDNSGPSSDNPWKRAPKGGKRTVRDTDGPTGNGAGSEDRKPAGRSSGGAGRGGFEKRPYRKESGGGDRPERAVRSEGGDSNRPAGRSDSGRGGFEKRPYRKESGGDRPERAERSGGTDARRPGGRSSGGTGAGGYEKRPYRKESGSGDRPERTERSSESGGGDYKSFKRGEGKSPREFGMEHKSSDRAAGSFGGKKFERKPYAKRDGGEGDGGTDRKFEKSGDRKFDRKPYTKRGEDKSAEFGSNTRSPRPYNKDYSKPRDADAPDGNRADKPYGKFGDRKFEKGPYRKTDDKSRSDRPYRAKPSGDFAGRDKTGKSAWAGKKSEAAEPIRTTVPGDPAAEPVEPPFSKSLAEVEKVQEIRAPYGKPSERKAANKKNLEIVDLKKERKSRKITEAEITDDAEDVKPLRKRVPKKTGKLSDHEAVAAAAQDDEEDTSESMPLNKYIAHSGECSRRDAAMMVKEGKVKVNGELVMDPGYKVKEEDKVTIAGKKVIPQKGMVYILLNKPKGFITTNDDPNGRRTVMELVAGAGAKRLYPVGRLDRDTTGLLLITNDGDLTQRMSHPSYDTKKVYQVTLDKALTKADFEAIMAGLDLEDGKVQVDEMAYLEEKNQIGLEIHSGKNRIVRRIFESLGYVVEKLDRVMYAGLTKKNLPRGKWRLLTDRELVLLKHFKS